MNSTTRFAVFAALVEDTQDKCEVAAELLKCFVDHLKPRVYLFYKICNVFNLFALVTAKLNSFYLLFIHFLIRYSTCEKLLL